MAVRILILEDGRGVLLEDGMTGVLLEDSEEPVFTTAGGSGNRLLARPGLAALRNQERMERDDEEALLLALLLADPFAL